MGSGQSKFLESENMNCFIALMFHSGCLIQRSIKSARAGLATDALNILRILIHKTPATTSGSLARRELRNYLRESLTTDHICSVVDLNRMITNALMESQLASKVQKKASDDNAISAFFSEHSGDYRHFEKLLW
jgi:hypothetical protein